MVQVQISFLMLCFSNFKTESKYFKTQKKASGGARQVKALAARLDDLSSVLMTHKAEGENWLPQVTL